MNPATVYPTLHVKDSDLKGVSSRSITGEADEEETSAKNELSTFAAEVSILGLKQSANPRYSYARRAVWLCFVLAGFGGLVYHLKDRIDYYRSNPATVNIEIIPNDTLVFPTLTLCTNSPFKASSLKANNETEVGSLFDQVLNVSAVNWTRYDFTHTNWTDFHMRNGFQVKDVFMSMSWNRALYELESLKPVITEGGLCYQFNSGDSHLHVDAEGMYGGLRLSILVSRKEYVKHSYLAGLSLNLHNPEDRPDGNTGILIPPGGFTNIALKLKHLVNLPPPHGKCGERPLAYYKKYSKTNCQTECLHNLTLTRCHCRLTFYPYVPGFRDCSPKDRKLCVDPLTFLNRSQLHRQCGCKVACETFKYETSSTYTKLSESTFENVQEWNMLQERLEDFIGVLIFYPDMSYEEVVQQEAYSTLALLADIGGALGLVLGSTLMTLAEILDFFFGLCVWKALGVRI